MKVAAAAQWAAARCLVVAALAAAAKAVTSSTQITVDVTEKCKKHVSVRGVLTVPKRGYNSYFTDPQPGVAKQLVVTLTDGSVHSFGEFDYCKVENCGVEDKNQKKKGIGEPFGNDTSETGCSGHGTHTDRTHKRAPKLLSCCRQPKLCCEATCCAPCMAGRQCGALHRDPGEPKEMSLAHCVGACFGLPVCTACIRMKIAEKRYGLDEGCIQSCCIGCQCVVCSLVQTQTLLKRHGRSPGHSGVPGLCALPSIKDAPEDKRAELREARQRRRDERRARNAARRQRAAERRAAGRNDSSSSSSSSSSSDSD